MSKPTLVLVHGSWHSPQHFGPIIQDLEAHRYKCVAVSLPSTQTPDTPPATLTDDTNAVRTAVVSELDSGNNVIVVAHSYGGAPANNALKDLSTDSRTASGHNTSVLAIAFLVAIPVPVGMTFLQMLGGKPHPLHDLRTPDFAWVGPPGPQHYFYNDMDPSKAEKWAAMLRQQSWPAYCEETSYAAYMEIPCFYLRCTKDQAFPHEAQGVMLEAVEAAGGRMRQETIGESSFVSIRMKFVWWIETRDLLTIDIVEADHTPFIGKSMAKTSDFIRRVAEGRFDA